MPQIRYWECVRYYRYLGAVRKDWRAFEVRVIIPFPADWDEDRVRRELERTVAVLDARVLEALENAFPGSTALEALIDAIEHKAASGWGRLPRRIDAEPITGFEPSDETEEFEMTITPAEIQQKLSDIRDKMEETRYRLRQVRPMTKEPEIFSIAPFEFRMQRAKLGALTREKKRFQRQVPEQEVEVTVVDKTKRYSSQFHEKSSDGYPARRTTTFYWRIPFET